MAYTFLQLKKAVEFAVAGLIDAGQTTPRVTSGMIVNKAIDAIEKAHNWTWLRATTTLPLTSGQPYIELPSDINELLGVAPTSAAQALAPYIQRVSVSQFLLMQTWTWPAQFIGYMQMGSSAPNNTTPAVRRLQIAPTPSATTADAVRIIYTRSLHRFPTDDAITTEDTYVLDIPYAFNEIVHEMCMAFAIQVEDEQVGADFSTANSKLATLIEQDKRYDEQADQSPQSVLTNQLPYLGGGACGYGYGYGAALAPEWPRPFPSIFSWTFSAT